MGPLITLKFTIFKADILYCQSETQKQPAMPHDPSKPLRWRQGALTPVGITSVGGSAVVHRGTVYVSTDSMCLHSQ